MSKLVVLELGEGDFEQQGFPVTLQIAEEGKSVSTKITGRLPPAPQVEQSYKHWQLSYRRLGLPMRLDDDDAQITNIGDFRDDCQEAGKILSDTLNDWLKSNSFTAIREEFLQKIKPDEKIRILLQTDEHLLQKLPWSLWELLKYYKNAEIALSPRQYKLPVPTKSKKKRKIKILAILGDSKGIDVENDQEMLKQELPDANIDFLVEPDRKELTDKLWGQGWDILFFAGHSGRQFDSSKSRIKINQTESLSIEDLKNALNKAIDKGLSLAIFNSCDGLGLAAELSAMQIPQMIVMRESILDIVAHEFLKHFLKAFARDQSLYLAVREARERLQGLEGESPCASWLPVIFQNPACQPFNWVPRRYAPKLQTVMVASVVVASLVVGVRHLGWLQPLELKAYDQMMQLRPEEGPDDRILVVEVTQRDILDQDAARGSSSLTSSTLTRLLEEINKHQPQAIGLDIYLDLSAGTKPNADLEKLFQENENLFAVCKVNNPKNSDTGGISPAAFIPKKNLGFSDVLLDFDGVLRRHLLYIEANSSSPCTAKSALSWELAIQYLKHTRGIEPESTLEGDELLGNARLKALSRNAGGYQTFGNNSSDNKKLDYPTYQILLNYRYPTGDKVPSKVPKVADCVNVNSILNQENYVPKLVKDRIVLIGVTDPKFDRPDGTPDEISTPYGAKMRGVYIHAQMVSQLISAALGDRPLLGVWSWWADGLWICCWSFVGGLIVWRIWGLIPVVLTTVVAIVILYGSCFFLFLQGLWVPFLPSVLALLVTLIVPSVLASALVILSATIHFSHVKRLETLIFYGEVE